MDTLGAEIADDLALDPHARLQALDAEHLRPAALRAHARRHRNRADALHLSLPESVRVGAFYLHVAPARSAIIARHVAIAEGAARRIGRIVRTAAIEAHAVASQAIDELSAPVVDVETLQVLRGHLLRAPATLSLLATLLKDLDDAAGQMSGTGCYLLDGEESAYWQAKHGPRAVAQAIARAENEITGAGGRLKQELEDLGVALRQESSEALHRVETFMDCIARDEARSAVEVAEEAKKVAAEIEQAEEHAAVASAQFESLDEALGPLPDLDKARALFDPFYGLWAAIADWHEARRLMLGTPVHSVNAAVASEALTRATQQLTAAKAHFQAEGDALVASAAASALTSTDAMRPLLPPLRALASSAIRQRHWGEVGAILGRDVDGAEVTGGDLLLYGVVHKAAEIVAIGAVAAREDEVNRIVARVEADQSHGLVVDLQAARVAAAGADGVGEVISNVDDLTVLLDEQSTTLRALMVSPYKAPFAERIDACLAVVEATSDMFAVVRRLQRTHASPAARSAPVGIDSRWLTRGPPLLHRARQAFGRGSHPSSPRRRSATRCPLRRRASSPRTRAGEERSRSCTMIWRSASSAAVCTWRPSWARRRVWKGLARACDALSATSAPSARGCTSCPMTSCSTWLRWALVARAEPHACSPYSLPACPPSTPSLRPPRLSLRRAPVARGGEGACDGEREGRNERPCGPASSHPSSS